MAKKKKKKVSHSQTTIADAYRAFRAGEFKRALGLIKNAKKLPTEVGFEKQLKSEIYHQLALELFLEFKFKEAIALLESNFQLEERKGYPIKIEKSSILIGICHLYLGDFNSAIVELNKVPAQPETVKFYFYKILAELYAGRYNDIKSIEEFKGLNPDYFEDAAPVQKQYLEAFFYFSKNNIKKTTEILEKIKPESHFQHQNIISILAIIKGNKIDEKSHSKLKPLYKLFVEIPIDYSERAYFYNFKDLENILSTDEQQREKQKSKSSINKLCELGVPMEQLEFESAMKDTSFEKSHSLIVYNQIAGLYNEDNDNKLHYVRQLIKKYWQLFLEVPESLFLYFNLLSRISTEQPAFFYNIIEHYLKSHENSLSPEQLSTIGWHIYYTLHQHQELGDTKISRAKVPYFIQKYPEMVGLKVWDLTTYTLGITTVKSLGTLDLFVLPTDKGDKKRILNEMGNFLESLQPDDSIFGSLMTNSEQERKRYLQNVTKLTTEINNCTKHSQVSRKAKDLVLSIYQLLHKHFHALMVKFEKNMPQNLLEETRKCYFDQISFFKETDSNSIYFKDYKAYLFLMESADLQRAVNEQKFKNFSVILNSFIEKGMEEELINYFLNITYERYYPSYLTTPFAMLIASFVHSNNIQEDKIQIIIESLQQEKEDEFGYEREEFIVRIIESLLVNFKEPKYYKTNYYIANYFVDEIVSREIPLYYNLAGKLLIFMKKILDTTAGFEYEREFTDKLLAFLKKVLRKRKNKSIQNIYIAAKDFFNFENKNRQTAINFEK